METESVLSEEAHNLSPQLTQDAGDIRYWSDFDRVYYLPRSLQKLPDPPEWESTDRGWILGHELFTRYNEVKMNVRYQLECIDIDTIGYRTCGRIGSALY